MIVVKVPATLASPAVLRELARTLHAHEGYEPVGVCLVGSGGELPPLGLGRARSVDGCAMLLLSLGKLGFEAVEEVDAERSGEGGGG